jgi:probable lipoprotein NlpC
MKIVLFCFLICCLSASCVSTQNKSKFIETVESFKGTPYKYGGMNRQGIDCSALIFRGFEAIDIKIPRVSYQQSEHFKEIPFQRVKKGDLLFFVTSGNTINHAGIVLQKKGKYDVTFLHASSSKGVREDNFNIDYWKFKFVKAVRPQFKEMKLKK